jgi:hypothetical protein
VNLAYLLVIAATHLAFAAIFGFFYWQKRSPFARTLAIAWLVEAVRVVPLLRQAHGADVSAVEWAAADCLFPVGILCLILAGIDLTGRAPRARWAWIYVGVTTALAISAHLWGASFVAALLGFSPEDSDFLATFVRVSLLKVPAGLGVLWLSVALCRCWRSTGTPGALIASVSGIPYALGILLFPAQWWFSFYPSWAHLAWFLQVLGLSTGFLILVLSLEHASLRRSQDKVRRLQGLLPICAWCKKVRDDEGYWREIEVYVRERSDADFSHGLCPQCMERLNPELDREDPGPAAD